MALLAAALLACGEQAGDAHASRAGPPDAGPACPAGQVFCGRCIEAIPPTTEGMVQRVFAGSCALSSACHSGPTPQEGLLLGSVEDVLRTAIGRPSNQEPSLAIIEPREPARSYLVSKVRGTDVGSPSGTALQPSSRMPPAPSSPLCAAKIEAIEAWIRAGANP